MIKNILLSLSVCSVAILIGCTTTQQTRTYQTLYTVEHVTTDTYSGYLDTVVKGQTATNSVPQVSKAYNVFQASYLIALDAAQYNTNALAPSALIQESTDVINLVNTVKGH